MSQKHLKIYKFEQLELEKQVWELQKKKKDLT